jgi:hypothetical protein
MSRYAQCADPTTAPATLAFLATEALPRAEQDALYRNPGLPFNYLFAALADGKTAALHNPALPLLLLTCPTAQVETDDGDDITLTGAILRCLAHALGALCKVAPRDGGVDVLRGWLFAALWGASRWYKRDTLDLILGSEWDAHDQWHEVTVGLCDGLPTGDRLGGSAEALVYRFACRFLGTRDVSFILALADNLAALDLGDGGERHLADVRAAARLLGYEAPRPVAHPDQLALFATEAA